MQRIQVSLPDGIVEGTAQDGIRRFYSLPYAAPMTEERRFRAPQPVERWVGVRDASVAGPRAPQNPSPPIEIDVDALMGKPGPEGGDYLTLDVYTPDREGCAAAGHGVHSRRELRCRQQGRADL
jgi:para-nitrobenzyl esterase